jgi:hypothetical protein
LRNASKYYTKRSKIIKIPIKKWAGDIAVARPYNQTLQDRYLLLVPGVGRLMPDKPDPPWNLDMWSGILNDGAVGAAGAFTE